MASRSASDTMVEAVASRTASSHPMATSTTQRVPSTPTVRGASAIRPSSVRPLTTIRRAGVTARQLISLAAGGWIARVRDIPAPRRRGVRFAIAWTGARCAKLIVASEVAALPFGRQLRQRMEYLGPSYIKLGQVLSLRRDLLPQAVTDELALLLDDLPAIPYTDFRALVEADLGRPVADLFAWIESRPMGSASIAQTHRAATLEGDSVVIKVVKPGIVETLARDARLMRWLGRVLQALAPRYQPRRVLDEFVTTTAREVDLRLEADNAERFAAHFANQDDVVFPRVFRAYSGARVLTMSFLVGSRPDAAATQRLSSRARTRLVDLGAKAVIDMIYRDGFFHADLHPGNLLVLDGPKIGFIDLGMVGQLSEHLRGILLAYYFCLSQGDAGGAARHLTRAAEPLRGADPKGFASAVEDVSRRWHANPSFHGFSLGQLILESVALGARFRMTFPAEMVLMVKALVTFEGVGNLLLPGFDIAAVSRPHIIGVLLQRFQPRRLASDALRLAPELLEALSQAPELISAGVRLLNDASERPAEHPLRGIRGTIFGGFCVVGGAIVVATNGPWPLSVGLFVIGAVSALVRSR